MGVFTLETNHKRDASMKEVWKDVPGFEGHYQVSNLGRVKSLDRFVPTIHQGPRKLKGKIRKQVHNGQGYLKVVLQKECAKTDNFVHRLVMQAFVGISNLQVNHINGVTTDNRLVNLEYVDTRENMNHRDTVVKKQKKYGVWFIKSENKWMAEICKDRERIRIGRFKTKDEAHQAYYDCYVNLHGVAPW